jgi:hypothetical protein
MFNIENRKVRIAKRRVGLRVFLLILCSMCFSLSANAQCAMCRAALNGEGNQDKATAINDGIVYLMLVPYVLVAALGYYIYRMKKKKS